jgi:hypothetical protein
VPWLDLLAEDDLEVVRVLLLDNGCDLVVESIKLLLAEGANVVEDCFLLDMNVWLVTLRDTYTVLGCG